jgi:hypothetical protein
MALLNDNFLLIRLKDGFDVFTLMGFQWMKQQHLPEA